LLPVIAGWPVVISTGPYASVGSSAHVGWSGQLFWGGRSYNPYARYTAAFGIVLRGEQPFTANEPRALWLGVELDGMWLALPFMALSSWVSGPADD
jgi:hypothetical protein